MLKTFCALVLAFSPLVVAQSPVTSPPGFLTTEAGVIPGIPVNPSRACYEFGAFPVYETQIFDAHLRSVGLRVIKQLDYRLDYRDHQFSPARTWSSVTLDLAPGQHDGTISTTNFTQNYTGTPTRVFSGSVTWPSVNGYPHANSPNPWGAEVQFPFTTSYIATTNTDLIHHYTFTGGTLSGGATWDEQNPSRYYLDAAFVGEASTGYHYPYSSGSPGCRDSNANANGTAYLYVQTFAPEVFNTGNNNLVKFDTRVFNGGPNAVHAMAYSLGRANIPFPGVACQNLGIDPTLLLLVALKKASSGGYAVNRMAFPYQATMEGARIHMQALWEDTSTKALLLSRQNLCQIAAQPPGKMRVLYKIGSNNAVLNMSMQRLPVTRYTF